MTDDVPSRMHDDEAAIDHALVTRLVASQFPHWAQLPVERLAPSGSDNAMFRLGEYLVIRLPRIEGSARAVTHEQRWLPRLKPFLPVACPEPVGLGSPGQGFAWPWSIYRFVDGENPIVGRLSDAEGLADDLAVLIRAFRRIDLSDAPPAGRSVAKRDPWVRAAIAELDAVLDTTPLTAFWDEAVHHPASQDGRVWMHGDLAPGNVLVRDGRLVGVIDFSGTGVGDPAGDLAVAWNLLPANVRPRFRAAVGADEAMWARTQAMAVGQALVQLPYYRVTNPPLAASARHVITEVLHSFGESWTPDSVHGSA